MLDSQKPLLSTTPLRVDTADVQGSGMLGSMFNLANSIIGAGVLTLPFAVQSTGLTLGATLLVVFAALSGVSLMLLYECMRIIGADSYAALAKTLYPGPRMWGCVEVLQALYSYGACVGYLGIVIDELEIVTGYNDRIVLLLGVGLVVYPLSLMKSMSALSFTSMLAIMCVSYLSVVLLIRFPPENCGGGSGTVEQVTIGKGLFTSLPIFCFAFNCQVQFIPIVGELRIADGESRSAKVKMLVWVVIALVCSLYVFDSVIGYLSFCADTDSNILDNYSNDILVKVGRVGFVVTLCFSFPLYSTAIISSVDSLMREGKGGGGGGVELAWRRRILLATSVVGSMMAIVSFNPPLESVLGLTGAVGGCSLVYVFPGLFYNRALSSKGGSKLALALASGGALLGVICAVSILSS